MSRWKFSHDSSIGKLNWAKFCVCVVMFFICTRGIIMTKGTINKCRCEIDGDMILLVFHAILISAVGSMFWNGTMCEWGTSMTMRPIE